MKITIIKQDPDGKETWRYSGTVISRGKNYLVIEAYFDRDHIDLHGLSLCKGDRFIETYYLDRWYNIFEIYDHVNDHLKGWYCNISSPAIENDGLLIYKDFALDLLVFPNGRQIILDEDEFAALDLSEKDQQAALAALQALKEYFYKKMNKSTDR
jgi:protein associated with RNAse G/E